MSESSRSRILRFACVMMAVLVVLAHPAIVDSVSAAGNGELTIDVEHKNGNQADEVNALIIYQDGSYYDEIKNYPGVDLKHTFSNLPTGHDYKVNAYIQDQFAGSTGPITIPADNTYTPWDESSKSDQITAENPIELSPTIYYSDGSTPIEGASVRVKSHEDDPNGPGKVVWRTATTESDGETDPSPLSLYPTDSDDSGKYTVEVLQDGEKISSGDYDELNTDVDLKVITDASVPEYDLSASADPSYAGDVDGEPFGSVEQGTEIQLTADPDSGHEFDHWSGDYPSGSREDADISVTVTEDKSLTAHFEEIPEYDLSVSSSSGGTVETSNTGSIQEGTDVSLTADATQGYKFSHWSGDYPSGSREDADISVTMYRDRELTANFEKLEGDLTVDVRHQNGDRAEEVNALVVWQDKVGGEPYKKFENDRSVAIKQKINNLPGDHRYKVNAYINDQFAGATDWVNIKNSDKSSTIRVENPVWIKPTVYYTDGSTPLEDATVKIESHEGTQWRSSTTEEDGLTSAGKLWLFPTNKGRYDVQVYSEGSRVASKTLNSLDSNRDLRLVTSVSPPTQIDTTVVGRTVREETEQDGTITVGERTKVGTTVRNDGRKMPLRVVFQFDTDGDSEPEAIDISGDSDPERVDYDEDGDNEPGTVRGNVEKTTVPEGEAQGFGLEYTPDLAGEWQVRAVIQAKPDTEWVQTDETAWKQYEVAGETEEAAFIQRDRDVIAPLPTGSFEWGKGLTAETTVKNTGTVKETFYVGYTASHKQSDRSYDVPERSVTLAPGETTDVALTWTVPNGAPTGKYQLDLALWRKSTDDGLTGNLDRVTGTVTVTPTEGAPIIVGYDPQDETFDNRTLARTEEEFEWADASVPDGQSSQDLDIPNIPDSPTRITSTEKYPWSAVGDLSLSLPKYGSISLCSGVVIEDNHVLTAAHCVVDDKNNTFIQNTNNLEFSPGFDAGKTRYEGSVEYIQLYKNYLSYDSGPSDTASNGLDSYDIAVLTLDREIGSQTGEFGYAASSPKSGRYGEAAHATGYPGKSNSNYVPVKGAQMDIPVTGEGTDFPTPIGATTCFLNDKCHRLGGRISGGLSGGPVWQTDATGNPQVISVVSSGGIPKGNIATRISQTKSADIGQMVEFGDQIELAPTGRLSISNSRVSVGQQLTLDASESRDPDQGNIQSYKWYLNRNPKINSPTMTTQSPKIRHTFDEPGKKTIYVEVVDNKEKKSTPSAVQKTVEVTDGPTGEDLATLVDDKAALPSGKFGPGDDVTATVTVENTGTVEETFHVGYTLTHRDSGTAYDVSPKDVTLAPGATQEVTLSWTVPETTQLGEFEATTAVWLDSTDEGLVGRQDDATETVTVTPDTPEFQNRAVYVWGYAGTLATNDDTANRFFERATDEDINTVFLSWGAFKSVSVSERAAFIKKAHKNNLQVHALIGTSGRTAVTNAKKTIPEIIAYNEGRDSAAQFDGIHLDAEPGGADVKSFLDEYRTLLDGVRTDIQSDSGASINSQKMALSAAVGPWWSNNAPTKTKQVVEQSALDYVVVMAYSDTEQEIKNRLSKITSDTDTPYVLAVETQEFTQGDKEDVTYYEEGQQDVKSTLQSIAGASSPGYLGSAYHFYQSSVSTWDALESASLRKTTIEPGDRVTVDTDVVFDDNFPQSSHRSQVRVEFDRQGSTYTVQETKTITPPGNQLTETSVEWQAPTDAQPGEYQVTASLVDTTRENDDREAVASRSEPITLDQIKLGTLEINEGAPSISDFAVEITDINNPPAGEQLEVTAEITNTGEQTGQATVQLDTTAGEIEPTQTTVNLGGGDSTTETLPVDTTGVDPGSYTATMSVGGTASDKQFAVTDPASLIADAGDDQTVTAGETVTLDATGSSSPDMGGLGYRFKQLSQPDSLPDVSLNNPETQTPEFTAPDVDSETTLTFELTITQTDSTGTTTDTDTDQVNITITPADDPLPTTSLRFTDQTISSGSATLSVDTAQFGNQTVPGEKFVVVIHKTTEETYGDGIGPKIGESDVLPPGTRQSVEVDLSRTLGPSDDIAELTKSQSLVAMLHRADTTDDDGDNINHGSHITRNGDKVTSRAQVAVSSPPDKPGPGAAWTIPVEYPRLSVVSVDIDSDDREELGVGNYDGYGPARYGVIQQGNWIWNTTSSAVVNAKTTADTDGDGSPEILFGARASSTWVRSYGSAPASRWSVTHGDWVDGSQRADTDGDGQDEVAVVSGNRGDLTVIDDGRVQWQPQSPANIEGLFGLTEVTGDDTPEILTHSPPNDDKQGLQLITKSDTGGVEVVWRAEPNAPVRATLSELDSDTDASEEVIAAYPGRGLISSVDAETGETRWREQVASADRVRFADVTGDKTPEVLLWSDTTLRVFSADSRSLIELSTSAPILRATGSGSGDGTLLLLTEDALISRTAGEELTRIQIDGTQVNEMSVGDTDGDNNPEVALGTGGSLRLYDNLEMASSQLEFPSDERPPASVTFTDQTISSGSATLSVDTAQFGNQTVPGEKFVVVVHKTTESTYDDGIGPKVGESDVLSPGTQQSVEVDLSRTLGPSDDIDTVSNSQSLVAMLHRADTDDDEINHGPHITRNGDTVTSRAQVTVSPPPGDLVADAGPDQTVTAGKTVELDASGSTAPDESALTYAFQQVSQPDSLPDVSLQDPETQTPEFTAPDVDSETTLTFELTITQTDSTGTTTDTDTDQVNITITPADDPLPTTSLRFTDQTLPNGSSTVTVDTAQFGNESVPGEKFVVVVHKTTESIYDDEIGPKVGESDVLSPGTRQSVEVDLSQTLAPSDDMAELTESQSLVAMLHRADTTDGDGITHGAHITRDGDKVTSRAQLTVSSSSAPAPTPALRTHRNLTSTKVTNGSTVTVTVTGSFNSPTDDAKLVDIISGGEISAENLTITDAAGAAFPVTTSTPTPTVDITWNGTLGTVSEAKSFTVKYEVQIPADTPVGTIITFDGTVTDSTSGETTGIDGDSSIEVVATTSPDTDTDTDTVTVGGQEVPTEFTSETNNGDRTVTADNAVEAINTFIAGDVSADVAVDVINAFIAS